MKSYVLFSLCVGLFGIPAKADEFIKMPHLPQNVREHFHISDPEIQILPTGPDINDLRNQQQNNQLKIIVGPNRMPTTQSNIVHVPGNNGEPTAGSIIRNNFPDANFCSHLQPNNHPLGLLPPGQTSKGLRNMPKVMTPYQTTLPQSSIPITANSIQQANTSTILQYAGHATQSTTGSNNSRVETKVKGVVETKRGDLLRPQ